MAGGLMSPMAQMMMARCRTTHGEGVRLCGNSGVDGAYPGPVLAGAILQHLPWRWLFLVNVPVGALALALAVLFIPEDDPLRQRRTFDVPGSLTLAPALVLFLYGADNIREHSGQLCLAIAIVMIIVFARGALRKGPEALLDLMLFRSGVFPASARTQSLQNGIVYATQLLLPLYLIKACGRIPGDVGVLLLPLGLGMLAGYPSIGWLTKHFGIRNVAAGGSLVSLLRIAVLISCRPSHCRGDFSRIAAAARYGAERDWSAVALGRIQRRPEAGDTHGNDRA